MGLELTGQGRRKAREPWSRCSSTAEPLLVRGPPCLFFPQVVGPGGVHSGPVQIVNNKFLAWSGVMEWQEVSPGRLGPWDHCTSDSGLQGQLASGVPPLRLLSSSVPKA